MISCAVTTSFLGCLVTMFLFIRYVWFLGLSPLANAAALVALLLIGCFPLLVSYRFENALGSLYPCYRYGLYYVFISAIILLTLTLVTDAVWFAGYKFGWFDCLPYSREFCIKYNLWLVGAAALFGAYALYAGTKIPDFKEITLSSPQINRKRTIVVLSDLHIHRVINPEKIKGIVAKTNAQNPDIILLAGDVIDDNVKSVSSTISLLKGLKAKEGIYFVTGNHEFYDGYKPTVETLKKLGFTLPAFPILSAVISTAKMPIWKKPLPKAVTTGIGYCFRTRRPTLADKTTLTWKSPAIPTADRYSRSIFSLCCTTNIWPACTKWKTTPIFT